MLPVAYRSVDGPANILLMDTQTLSRMEPTNAHRLVFICICQWTMKLAIYQFLGTPPTIDTKSPCARQKSQT